MEQPSDELLKTPLLLTSRMILPCPSMPVPVGAKATKAAPPCTGAVPLDCVRAMAVTTEVTSSLPITRANVVGVDNLITTCMNSAGSAPADMPSQGGLRPASLQR